MNEKCPCGACLDEDPELCIRFRYNIDINEPIEFGEEECSCSCHDEYEFPDEEEDYTHEGNFDGVDL
jgi:hypothetical protein